MTVQEKLTKAEAFLEASDELSARELVDSVLAEDPHNSVALRLDDRIARQNVAEERDRHAADRTDLGFVLPWRSQSIVIGVAIALLGMLTLLYVGSQVRASVGRQAAITAPG